MTNSVPVARNYAIDWPTNTKKKHKKEIKLVILFFYGFFDEKKNKTHPKFKCKKSFFKFLSPTFDHLVTSRTLI